MTNLDSLLAQRKDLDAQIAAQKISAIQQVRDFMVVMGVTIDDLLGPRRPLRVRVGKDIKYRDEAGNEWGGVGPRPKWLKARLLAGADLADFRVRK